MAGSLPAIRAVRGDWLSVVLKYGVNSHPYHEPSMHCSLPKMHWNCSNPYLEKNSHRIDGSSQSKGMSHATPVLFLQAQTWDCASV